MAYDPNPQLLQAIRRTVPRQYQPLVLATALVESGGRLDAVGDNGQSYGPYQEYTGGRGAGLAPAQRMDPFGATQRAWREFSSLSSRYSGPELAYRAQRPADHAGYVQKIQSALPVAQKLLGDGSAADLVNRPTPQSLGVTPKAIQPYADSSRRQRSLLAIQAIGEIGHGGVQPSTLIALGQSAKATQAAPTPRSPARDAQGPQPPGYRPTKGDGAIGGSGKIIGTPGAGTHTLGNWESDNAVDIAAPVGTPVYALQDGVIGSQFGSLGSGGRFAGLRLHLKTRGDEFYYAHLSRFAPGIQPGAQVRAGQLLGYSGEANGVGHLHLGARSGDPRRYLR